MFWLDDLLEILSIMLAAAIAIVSILGLLFGVGYAIDRWQCAGYEIATGKDTNFVALTCYVQTENGWQARDEYINRAMASEGLKANSD